MTIGSGGGRRFGTGGRVDPTTSALFRARVLSKNAC